MISLYLMYLFLALHYKFMSVEFDACHVLTFFLNFGKLVAQYFYNVGPY